MSEKPSLLRCYLKPDEGEGVMMYSPPPSTLPLTHRLGCTPHTGGKVMSGHGRLLPQPPEERDLSSLS